MGGEQRSIEPGPQGSKGYIDVRRLQSACIFKPVDHNSLFVAYSETIVRCHLDEWSAFRRCRRELVEFFKSTGWALYVNLTPTNNF